LAGELFDIDDTPSAVVGLGFDAFATDPGRFRSTFDLSEPFILYCGRREGGKNTPLLVDYFSTYMQRRDRALRLVLAGSGHAEIPDDALETIVDLDYLEEQEKRDAMAAAEVFVQPSVNESFSIVLMEGWLAGAPALVHARCRVTRDHCLHAGGGLYFDNYPEFEACLDRVLDDSDLRARLAEGGRRYVETHYTWAAVMDRLEAALRTFET
jgi:glycosyltransferase involved in cell wall biosynthesis